ncbi:hypothetical protein [Actinocrispum wychmicini]|uniref:Uncharacterized protein n=1 Tax=Actinocrispum wychmicini TaxID=1213861 RepID=A0A4R2JC75_9PSEU|nr:hypothetical protein [Actinocrispum wychmicini]TCO57141.1 hypothetical protein EV192_106618 [Actinocrispum wychmicini]
MTEGLTTTEREADKQAAAARAAGPAEPDPWAGRHPSIAHFQPLFDYDNLPAELQAVSGPCGALAEHMLSVLPDGIELTVGLRKLLEAKDAFVRHTVLTGRAEARHDQ